MELLAQQVSGTSGTGGRQHAMPMAYRTQALHLKLCITPRGNMTGSKGHPLDEAACTHNQPVPIANQPVSHTQLVQKDQLAEYLSHPRACRLP